METRSDGIKHRDTDATERMDPRVSIMTSIGGYRVCDSRCHLLTRVALIRDVSVIGSVLIANNRDFYGC